MDGLPDHAEGRPAPEDRGGEGAERRADRRAEGRRRSVQADVEEVAMSQPPRPPPAHQVDQRHRADHEGHADGGGVEDAQGAAGRARRGAVRAPAVPHPAQRDARGRADFTHPLLEVREVRRRAVILIAPTRACAARSTPTSSAWRRSSIRRRRSSSPPAARPRSSSRARGGSWPPSSPTAIRRRFPRPGPSPRFARDLFLKGEVDEVRIVTTRFVNTLTQEPVSIEYLPVGAITGLEGSGRGIRGGAGRRHGRDAVRAQRPRRFWAICSATTSTSTSTTCC